MNNYILSCKELYGFLCCCNKSVLPKKVLDCGAGGKTPPLAIFYQQGYETKGIDISKEALKRAHMFENNRGITLNIELGDMRNLSFKNNSFSFLYSYNSIFHLHKKDIAKTISEFKRVVAKTGLIYVNFLSVDDFLYGTGEALGFNMYQQQESHGTVIHSFYTEAEVDELFSLFKIISKQKRVTERYFGSEKIKQAYLDYIVQVI